MKEAQIVTLEIRTYYGHLVFETSGDSIKECVFQALASGICLSDSNCDPAPVRPVDRDTFMVDFQDMQTLKDLILIECRQIFNCFLIR